MRYGHIKTAGKAVHLRTSPLLRRRCSQGTWPEQHAHCRRRPAQPCNISREFPWITGAGRGRISSPPSASTGDGSVKIVLREIVKLSRFGIGAPSPSGVTIGHCISHFAGPSPSLTKQRRQTTARPRPLVQPWPSRCAASASARARRGLRNPVLRPPHGRTRSPCESPCRNERAPGRSLISPVTRMSDLKTSSFLECSRDGMAMQR